MLGKPQPSRPRLAPLFGGPGGEAGPGVANGPGDAGREEEEEEEYQLLTVTLSKLKHSLGGWHTGGKLGVGGEPSFWHQLHWDGWHLLGQGHPIEGVGGKTPALLQNWKGRRGATPDPAPRPCRT